MSVFKIEKINRIITGPTEKIVNIQVNDNGKSKDMNYILDVDSVQDELNDDQKLKSFINGHNIYGLKPLSDDYVIRDMYDVKDVAIKSAVGTRLGYSQRAIDNDNIDIYLPHQDENLYNFCQVQGHAYGLTRLNQAKPIIERTNIRRSSDITNAILKQSKPEYSYWLNSGTGYKYTSNLVGREDDRMSYYIYNNLSDLTDADGNTPSSLYSYLTSYGELSVSMISTLYMPKYALKNVGCNYIVEIPVADSNANDYRTGNIAGDIIAGKMLYNSIYSEESDKKCNINHSREYVDIDSCGDTAFLKYYDDNSITVDKNDLKGENEILDIDAEVKHSDMLHHQKVEVINSINRFLSTNKHKANAYSIRLHNMNLDEVTENKDVQDKIKMDIENSIRNLVKYLTPAHTQLIEVQYKDD